MTKHGTREDLYLIRCPRAKWVTNEESQLSLKRENMLRAQAVNPCVHQVKSQSVLL